MVGFLQVKKMNSCYGLQFFYSTLTCFISFVGDVEGFHRYALGSNFFPGSIQTRVKESKFERPRVISQLRACFRVAFWTTCPDMDCIRPYKTTHGWP